jgi:hypothetical protein
MHAAADLYEPRLRWAAEGLQALLAQHGPRATIAWARAAADDETRIDALAVLEQVPLALNLLANLERARQSGNPRKVARVNKRLDYLLAWLGSRADSVMIAFAQSTTRRRFQGTIRRSQNCRTVMSVGDSVMARMGEDEVEVEPGEAVVERKVIPVRSRSSSVVALAIRAAFLVTCVVVFAGGKLGLREQSPFEKAAENITAVPTPAAPVER